MSLEKVEVATVNFSADGQSGDKKAQIKTEDPIVAILVEVEALQASGSGGTVTEDAAEKMVRQVRLLEGEDEIQEWGHPEAQAHAGVIAQAMDLLWMRTGLNETADPATSGTPTVKHQFTLPVAAPWKLYGRTPLYEQSALRIPGSDATFSIDIVFADILADLISGGSGYSFSNVKAIVSIIIDTSLARKYPKGSFLLKSRMQKLGLDLNAAESDEPHDLPRLWEIFADIFVHIDNGVRNDANLRQLQYRIGQRNVRIDTTWDGLQAWALAQAGTQIPVPAGFGMWDFDPNHIGALLPAATASGFELLIDTLATSTDLAALYRQTIYRDFNIPWVRTQRREDPPSQSDAGPQARAQRRGFFSRFFGSR